jgi:hypothetical protein
MSHYNALVAEKLKIISEIQRVNYLIDSCKKEGLSSLVHLERLEQLKSALGLIDMQILTFKATPSNQTTLDPTNPTTVESKDSFVIENDIKLTDPKISGTANSESAE